MSFCLSQGSIVDNGADSLYGTKSKVFNDPIHGFMRFDELCVKVIDTPQFQRLRDLKQLGSCYFAFPGSSHNRFEHCLGVGHLSGIVVERFKALQPELDITQRQVQLLRMAGLVHDLGHGPFSHVFDNEFMPRARPNATVQFHHEIMSAKMLDLLVDENHIEVDSSDVRFVKELITSGKDDPPIAGTTSGFGGVEEQQQHGGGSGSDTESICSIGSGRNNGMRFLFDIVANARNGIDVDKLDYLARDPKNVGVESFDFRRLLNYSRVIDDEICFEQKTIHSCYDLFYHRYMLFKEIYTHRATKAVEYMICDAMLEANNVMKIAEAVDDPREYQHLTDHVLKTIEVSKQPELAAARRIVLNIRKRNLYQFVDEELISPAIHMPKITAEMVRSANPTSVNIPTNAVIVHEFKLGYGMGDENPMKSVKFYRSSDPNTAFHFEKERVSLLLPEHFQERVVRVYSRDRDIDVLDAIQKSFRAILNKYTTVNYRESPAVKKRARMPTVVLGKGPGRRVLELGMIQEGSEDQQEEGSNNHDEGRGTAMEDEGHALKRSRFASVPTGTTTSSSSC